MSTQGHQPLEEGRDSGQVEADLLKAAEILCLSHAAYEEIAPDELYADELEREGLLICGSDRTGDGYTDITSEGYAFLSDVFERARIEKWGQSV